MFMNDSYNRGGVLGDEDTIELLVRAARMYYEQQLTQAEIGQQLNTSRSTVSRLLQEARDAGIVQITISYPWERDDELEEELKQIFALHTVRVLRTLSRTPDEVMQGQGLLAARFLDEIVHDDMILGVSFGRAVASTIKQLKPARRVNMTVVQIIGALGSESPLVESPDLVRAAADAYGAQYRYLHTPLIVKDRRTRDLLIPEPYVQDTLNLGKRADVVIVGIGSLASSTSGLIYAGYLTENARVWLRNIGAVGHMCAQFFDAMGTELDIDLNKQVIGIGLEALREINQVVAVAGSKEKAPAILGALRGGYINSLVTDDRAATEIIKLAQSAHVSSG